ncbi:MAG: hypothetical protein KAH95_13575 [Spirochaetales bacterium]|nr:hypothetical protein [Spirochaetales bacterium]
MKKLLFILMILLLAATMVSAQVLITERIMNQIGMSQEEIKIVLSLQQETQQRIQISNAELGVLKAQLTRELVNEHPDMNKVEKIVEETLHYRLRNEMDTIKLRVNLKEEIGKENWRKILLLRERITQPIEPSLNPGTRPDPTPNPPDNYGSAPAIGPGPGRD